MPICSLCGRCVERECDRCKEADHKIARKYNKHDGGVPKSLHKVAEGIVHPKPLPWPKFNKDAKPPEQREPVT